MVEYKVRRCDGDGVDEPERVCNELAKEGWRLVSAAVAVPGPGSTLIYLFFEREAAAAAMADEEMARMVAQFATSATR